MYSKMFRSIVCFWEVVGGWGAGLISKRKKCSRHCRIITLLRSAHFLTS